MYRPSTARRSQRMSWPNHHKANGRQCRRCDTSWLNGRKRSLTDVQKPLPHPKQQSARGRLRFTSGANRSYGAALVSRTVDAGIRLRVSRHAWRWTFRSKYAITCDSVFRQIPQNPAGKCLRIVIPVNRTTCLTAGSSDRGDVLLVLGAHTASYMPTGEHGPV